MSKYDNELYSYDKSPKEMLTYAIADSKLRNINSTYACSLCGMTPTHTKPIRLRINLGDLPWNETTVLRSRCVAQFLKDALPDVHTRGWIDDINDTHVIAHIKHGNAFSEGYWSVIIDFVS